MAGKKRTFPLHDLTGAVFGRLTVLAFAGFRAPPNNRPRQSWWTCKCTCGKVLDVRGNCLPRQNSCGCSLAEFRANKLPEITKRRNIRPLGHAAKMGLLDDYTRRAKYKGRAFALSPAQFFAITKMDCHYCGVGPQQVARGGASGSNGIYLYNGIDRVDSSAGYTLENTVPACGLCNKAKRDLTYLEFREWLERVVSYNERQAY